MGYPPLKIKGHSLDGGVVNLSGAISSQFISSLLMIAPTMRKGLTIHLEGNIISRISSGTLTGNIFPGIMASCPIAMPTVMARADILKNDHFPEHFEIGEDVCLWIKLASKYKFGGIDGTLSKVRVGPNTAALNKRKQAMGYINIAYFLIHDSYLSQFDRQIKSLLLDATTVFSDSNVPLVNVVNPSVEPSIFKNIRSDLRKVLYSLRNTGLRMTFQRIRRRFGI